jgi:6-phosphogluconolactonase
MKSLVVEATRDNLVHRVANDFLDVVGEATSESERVDIVLTGGTVGIDVLREVSTLPEVDQIDWSKVRIWWGDERFVPDGDSDRNELQAREALLHSLPLSPGHIHPFPADDGQPLESALSKFRKEFEKEFNGAPVFALVVNGMGPDGHVASLFPGLDQGEADDFVIAIDDSPKPPAKRLSLTFRALNASEHVWIIAAGSDKAAAIAQVMTLEPTEECPATLLKGHKSTRVYVDALAASELH